MDYIKYLTQINYLQYNEQTSILLLHNTFI